MSEPTLSAAHKVYNIAHWSDGYIDVNTRGEVLIRPDRGTAARTSTCLTLPAPWSVRGFSFRC